MYGFEGVGMAMLAVYIIDLVTVWSVARMRLGFEISANVLRYFLLNLPSLLLLAYSVVMFDGWLYWVTGMLCAAVSSAVSLSLMKRQGVTLMKLFKRLFARK